jgi:hypothetical protein
MMEQRNRLPCNLTVPVSEVTHSALGASGRDGDLGGVARLLERERHLRLPVSRLVSFSARVKKPAVAWL